MAIRFVEEGSGSDDGGLSRKPIFQPNGKDHGKGAGKASIRTDASQYRLKFDNAMAVKTIQ